MFAFFRSGSPIQLVCGGSVASRGDLCKTVTSADSIDSGNDISSSATVVSSLSVLEAVNKHVPSLCDEALAFKPSFPLIQGDIQTIFSLCANIDGPLCYDRSFIPGDNGGTLALDLASSPCLTNDAPIVIILPGLAGSSQNTYVNSAVRELSKHREGDLGGYRVVVMNPRGGGSSLGNPLTSAHFTHAGSTEDVRVVVSNVRKQYPDAKSVFALGFSIGGALPLRNKVTIVRLLASSVFRLFGILKHAASELRILRRLLFSYPCGANLVSIVREYESVFRTADSVGLDVLLARRATRMSTFNAIFMSQLAGYADSAALTAATSPIFRLGQIRRPCVLLNSRDDPFYGGECLKEMEKTIRDCGNDRLVLAITERGGHLGWMQKNKNEGKLEQWFARPVREFFDGIIREGKEKI